MKYIYSNNLGEEIILNDITKIEDIVKKPFEYWLEGTGDTSIHINDDERIIFFKIEEGVFIMQHPDYLAPKMNTNEVRILKHYVGGQEMFVPSTCICDESQAIDILTHYIEKEELPDSYSWVDFYEEMEGFQE